ncbi:amidase family protein [Paenibacillus durus]|uniref:Amidase n=1 Tax=Paenibacillus durus ATCC 35681 TaxID=1333534 RepID=A0A0F7F7X2_PAEDU|nr:amidase family protein [Paenibacillus durus]AKG33727.1 amidase [Paenibacillus durus ATCC 35681]
MKDPFKMKTFDVEETSIFDLQDAMAHGKTTSRELVFCYLSRIAKYDQDGPHINSVMEINPDAIFIAEALDLERQRKGSRGPLHGIPILVKDNIETGDKMRTSAGALALAQHVSTEDAFLIRRLREKGAVILGKTNMTEWANGVSSTMWAGYSSKGGQVTHPYGEFFTGGSSTGSAAAVAASLAAAAIGTETSASILSPAVQMSIVGIKPTVGLISRSGIIPFSYSQDTAGPMARTVSDAAILLNALVGRDEQDPATWRGESCHTEQDYTAFLDREGLYGARIGVFCEVPDHVRESGEYDEALFNQAVSDLIKAGAEVVEQIDIPSFHGPWQWNKMNLEFKHGIENYLQRLPAHMPIHSLSELLEWNKEHAETALKYGQDLLEFRERLTAPLKNKDYILESIMDLHLAQNEGIDYAIKRYQLDAIMFPAYIGADLCARAGYPSIAIPAGYRENGRPFGITFAGTAFSEPALIRIAYSFEQRTKHRKKPVFK